MRIYLIVLFALLGGVSSAQVQYFNEAHQTEGVQEYYRNVFVLDSSYVLPGGFVTDTSGFLFRTHGFDGEILSTQTIAPGPFGSYWIPPRCFTHTDDFQNYFMFSSADIGNGQQGFLMKMDANFDTLWTKYYDLDPDGKSFFDAGVVHDNHLILVAECNNFTGGDYSNRLRIVKLDMDGNLIWNKVVDEPLQWELYLPRYLELSDSGYLIGAGRFWFNGSETEATSAIRKTDFSGELLWSFDDMFDMDFNGEFESEILWHSSHRLFAANTLAHTETVPGSGIYYVDLVLRELDMETGIQIEEWQIIPAVDLMYLGAVGLVESQDHQLIVLHGAITPGTKPYLMKVDTLGNVLWEHEYCYEPDENWLRQTLWDIKNTPDGGYIMAGELNHADAPNDRWSWVLKVDGCGDVEWQNCEVVGLVDESQLEFSIYPNPASDYLIVELASPVEILDVSITDMLGRMVMQDQIRNGAPLDLRTVDSGSYLLTVYSEDQIVLSKPIEIE